ncbi:MAG: hypothetical protein RR280_04400 [Bacteroidaceae bacterium]
MGQIVTRMAHARATHVSLVERGANQTPFKIVKSDKSGDKSMSGINLSSVIKSATGAKQSTVVGVVVLEGKTLIPSVAEQFQLGAVEEVRKAADTGEQGDIHIITKSAFEGEDQNLVLVEVSPEVSVVLKSFRPYNDEFTENASFADIIKARTLPIWRIGEVISELLSNVLYDAADKNEAVTNGAAVLEDSKKFLTELFSSLPDTVFKMALGGESLITKSDEPVDGSQQTVDPAEGSEVNTDGENNPPAGGEGDNGTGGDGSDGSGAVSTTQVEESPQGGTEGGGVSPTAGAEGSVVVTKEPTPATAPNDAPFDVAAFSASLVDQIQKSFQPKFEELERNVQSIAKTAQDAEVSTQKVLGSTVLSNIQKSNTTPAPAQNEEVHISFDTAYHRPR